MHCMTLNAEGRDSDMFGAQYLENSWRYRLTYNGAPTGNGTQGILANTRMK